MNKINTELSDKLKLLKISTSIFTDIMDEFKTGSVLSYKLQSQNLTNYYLAAQAYTVQWKMIRKSNHIFEPFPSSWEQVRNFLVPELCNVKNLVYVAGSGKCIRDAALAGGMSCTYFEKLGFSGVIAGGAVRDGQDLGTLSIPVIATNLIPADTQGAYYVSETGGSCQIEQTVIHTGDLIIADINGVVVIPFSDINTVISKAIEIIKIENNMMEKIRRGERLPDLINTSGRI